ncbi:TOG array regulator of axonemal microtubules protein 2 [Pyrus x bretschneideri]|uniref:TOG array regulator of axonemal microtubules protein 2 n=1 Tax=Pyrus x bretschneideri TaxID=225117 RepID=UPI00202E9D71|nr:TOG array regulator of axonemal microtubules protein 2 [Pyrus x bretschneideri]
MAMALRPIDNALSTTPERPKKQTKVAVPIQKQKPEFGLINDENQAPLPATADAAIDYISSENLKPISDPDLKIQSLNEGLESKDWVKVCESLNNVRRFALYHPALLAPTLEKVMVVLVKAMKNPRSALIKTSIMASSDIFTAFGDGLLESAASNAFDQLLLQLLLKSSQDKRFVCEEADRALSSMVQSLTPLPLLQKLRAYASHGNPRVRAKAAISVASCVAKMGLEGMKDYGVVSLVKMAADLLNDRLPEAREAARGIVMSVYNAYTENEEEKLRENEEEKSEKQEIWLSFCQSNLSTIHVQSMVKITSSQ